MRSLPLLLLGLVLLLPLAATADPAPSDKVPETTPEEATRTEVGRPAPAFRLTTVDGEIFDLAAQRGKVVLVNFFATWCGPCIREMPHLQKEVVDRFAGEDFAFLAVGREHRNEELPAFAAKHGLDLPMAGDPTREVYALYAEHTIPRNVVVGRDGTILFQSIGFEPADFERMLQVLERALSEEPPSGDRG
jgi:peroxiredoxin